MGENIDQLRWAVRGLSAIRENESEKWLHFLTFIKGGHDRPQALCDVGVFDVPHQPEIVKVINRDKETHSLVLTTGQAR